MPEQPLLVYTVTPQPDPLLISTPTTDQQGTLTIAVSVDGAPVYCEEIAFGTMYGDGATDLFQGEATFSCSSPDWQGADQALKPDTGLQMPADRSPQRMIFRPVGSTYLQITTPLQFTIQGTVGTKVGTSTFVVTERSSHTADGGYQFRSKDFAVTKEEFVFYVRNLAAADPTSPAQPRTRFRNGADILLSWESTGTSFVVYVNNTAMPAQSATTYLLKGGITRDTTVFLAATSDNGTASEKPTIYEALALTVDDPDLVAKSLAVTGQSSLAGATLSGDLVTPGVVSANTVKCGVIEGDVTFKGKVTFEQDVIFEQGATFNGKGTFFNGPIYIGVPDKTVWTIFATEQQQWLYFMNTTATSSSSGNKIYPQIIMYPDGSTSGQVEGTYSKYFRNGDPATFGNWSISVTSDHKLNFSHASDVQIKMDMNGRVSSTTSEGSLNYFHDGDPFYIYLSHRNGYLNATEKGDRAGDHNVANAYWKNTGNPDKDSNLTIRYGTATGG